jgi:hypothetical protein
MKISSIFIIFNNFIRLKSPYYSRVINVKKSISNKVLIDFSSKIRVHFQHLDPDPHADQQLQ